MNSKAMALKSQFHVNKELQDNLQKLEDGKGGEEEHRNQKRGIRRSKTFQFKV